MAVSLTLPPRSTGCAGPAPAAGDSDTTTRRPSRAACRRTRRPARAWTESPPAGPVAGGSDSGRLARAPSGGRSSAVVEVASSVSFGLLHKVSQRPQIQIQVLVSELEFAFELIHSLREGKERLAQPFDLLGGQRPRLDPPKRLPLHHLPPQ